MKKWKFVALAVILYALSIYIIGIIESQAENSNIKGFTDALWYAIVTLTTVGYGDYFPVTPLGKIVGLILIIGSIGVLGYIIGEITTKINQYMEKKKNGYWGIDYENHYIIIGWSDFGRQVVQQIFNTGHKIAVVVNDKNDLELVKDLFSDDHCFVMFADFNNMEALKKININKSKGVFVNFEEDTEKLVFILNLKKIYPNADVVVTCKNPSLKDTFKNAGIHYVISQTDVASKLVASYIFEPQVASYTEDLISTSITDTDFDIQQYKAVPGNPFIDQPYFDVFVSIKKTYSATLIGLVIDNVVVKNPPNEYKIKQGDYFILISDGTSKRTLEKIFQITEGE